MLLKEEEQVLHWLKHYGTMDKRQVRRLLHECTDGYVSRLLMRLKREGYLFEQYGFISADPRCTVDRRMNDALWVLSQYAGQIGPADHYPADYPAQMFCIKGTTGYEIVVLTREDAHLTRLLRPTMDQASSTDIGDRVDMKYLIVLPHISMRRELMLPDAPCMFVTLDYSSGDVHGVNFYAGGDGGAQ